MIKSALITAALVTLSFSALNAAQEPAVATAGPEVVTFKMNSKTIELQHWKHQKRAKKGGCTNCHRGEIGKIEDWNQEFAHMVCISCHDINDKGPVKCKECHTK